MKFIQKSEIEKVARILKAGGIVAMPTDTILGLSCIVEEKAINKLIKLKQCDNSKLFILLVDQSYPIEKLVELDSKSKEFISKNSPNPVTFVCKKSSSAELSSHFNIDTIAIRIPKDEFLQKVLEKVGYIISTSCNIHGQPCLQNEDLIAKTFPEIDAIVKDDNEKNSGLSSTIVDITTDEFKILRQGQYKIR